MEIQEAYDVSAINSFPALLHVGHELIRLNLISRQTLSDETKRKAYDQYGSASQQPGFDPNAFGRNPFGGGGGGGGFGGFQDFGSAFGGGAGGMGGNASDMFEQLFGAFGGAGGRSGPFGGMGGGAGPRAPARGEDIETVVSISFMDSCSGTKKKVSITPIVECSTCTGSGLKAGAKRDTCTTCRGTGQQTFSLQGMLMASSCQACGGAGSVVRRGDRCGGCEGVGRVKEKRTVEVDIPAGIEDGMKIRMPTAGDIPLSGPGTPGDVLVRVNVQPSKQFRRQGSNLYHTSQVPVHTALLGGRMRIPTLEGDVEVRVKGGTRDGEEAVLKGRGVKSVYGRERGDLVVNWKIVIPR
jgi:molecular chaperone DnaJ